jgi:hypothetical protein
MLPTTAPATDAVVGLPSPTPELAFGVLRVVGLAGPCTDDDDDRIPPVGSKESAPLDVIKLVGKRELREVTPTVSDPEIISITERQ